MKIRIGTTQDDIILGENEIAIIIDKGSRLKNPYYMYHEGVRDEVCDRYKVYFYEQIEKSPQFLSELNRILKLSKKHNIALLCWCYPKRNFVETIKEWLDNQNNA